MTKVFIQELTEGQQFSAPFLIKTKQLLPFKSKNGKFLHLVVGDKTGEMEARMWEGGEEAFALLNDIFVANIQGEVVKYKDALQINITAVSPAANISPDHFLPESPRDKKEMVDELREYVAEINNPHLKQFLITLFADADFFHKYTTAPAAKQHHQAYLHGLLEHSLGVAAVSRAIAAVYPGVDLDLLTTGAIIHDMGKVEELSFSGNFDYTDQGRLVGHLVIGAQMVNQVAGKIPGFPEELTLKLTHLVVSHHGHYEWQSPKKPKFLEALLLHHADLLDSQVDKFVKIKEQAGRDASWSPWVRGLDRYIYLK